MILSTKLLSIWYGVVNYFAVIHGPAPGLPLFDEHAIPARSLHETTADNEGQRRGVYGIIASSGKKRRICVFLHP